MNADWDDLIDRYLRYELSEEEMIQLDELRQSDAEFAQQLKVAEHIAMAIEMDNEKKALQEMLIQPKPRMAASPGGAKKKLYLTFSFAAAAIALLLYIGFARSDSDSSLFEQYYTALAYEEIPSRGDYVFTNEQMGELQQAISFYQNRNYKQAIELFSKGTQGVALPDIPEDVSIYMAICELETDDTTLAINRLKHLTAHGKLFLYDAKWYLALAYLREGEKNNCIFWLEELQQEKNMYRDRAIDLIKALK